MAKDRFDAIAEAAAMKYLTQVFPGGEDLAVWMARLLRTEHAAVVRRVNSMPAFLDSSGNNQGHFVNKADLLKRLAKRKG